MTTNRHPETTAMITVDCPWCQAPAEITATAFECADCGVAVSLAEDVKALPLAA